MSTDSTSQTIPADAHPGVSVLGWLGPRGSRLLLLTFICVIVASMSAVLFEGVWLERFSYGLGVWFGIFLWSDWANSRLESWPSLRKWGCFNSAWPCLVCMVAGIAIFLVTHASMPELGDGRLAKGLSAAIFLLGPFFSALGLHSLFAWLSGFGSKGDQVAQPEA